MKKFLRNDLYSIFENSWPLLGIMLLNFAVGYTDVYVAGLIGTKAQAVVGLSNQIFFMSIVVGNAIAVGTVAFLSRAVGSGKRDEAKIWASQSVVTSFWLGFAVSFMVWAFAREIIQIFDVSKGLFDSALSFLRVFSTAIWPNYVLIVGTAVLRSLGKPRKAFLVMSLSALLNIPGDFIFAFGYKVIPALGTAGIAFSSVIALAIGAVTSIYVVFRELQISFEKKYFAVSFDRLRNLFKISWPSVVLQLAFQSGTLVLYRYLSALGSYGITAMAAYTNGIRIESIVFLPAFAISMAVAVLVGHQLGKGDIEKAKHLGYVSALFSVFLLFPVAFFLFWKAKWVASWLSSDPLVIYETARYIRINVAFYPFLVSSIVLNGAMQGAGDTRGTMLIIIVSVWLIRIPIAGVLSNPLVFGASGVWWAMAISMMCKGLMSFWRFKGDRWHKILPA